MILLISQARQVCRRSPSTSGSPLDISAAANPLAARLPFGAAFGANTRFSSALGTESTLVGDALLLAGASYT